MNRAGCCPENSQQASVHVDSVAWSVAASFSFLLACILTCVQIDIVLNAKTGIIIYHTLHVGQEQKY